MRSVVLRVSAAATVALIAGCGSSTIGQATIEKQVSEAIEASAGQAPDRVSCPGELTPSIGAEMRCTIVERGTPRGLTLRITAVDGAKIALEIHPDRPVQNR